MEITMSDLYFDEYRARLAQLLSHPQGLTQTTRLDIAGLFEAALARAEAAEADAAQLRARVAALEAELAIEYRMHRQLPGIEVSSGAA